MKLYEVTLKHVTRGDLRYYEVEATDKTRAEGVVRSQIPDGPQWVTVAVKDLLFRRAS